MRLESVRRVERADASEPRRDRRRRADRRAATAPSSPRGANPGETIYTVDGAGHARRESRPFGSRRCPIRRCRRAAPAAMPTATSR